MARRYREELRQLELASDPRVITEAQAPYRIVHVNKAWCTTSGYPESALIGETCKILQGPQTCVRTMQASTPQRRSPLGFPRSGGFQPIMSPLAAGVGPHALGMRPLPLDYALISLPTAERSRRGGAFPSLRADAARGASIVPTNNGASHQLPL